MRTRIPLDLVYTDALVDSLMRIAATRPSLEESLSASQKAKLLSKIRSRRIAAALRLEGQGENNDSKSLASDSQHMLRLQAAYDYAENLAQTSRPATIADLRDLQALATRKPPVPPTSPGPLEDLARWLDDTRGSNPFARAFAFHFLILALQPFERENGPVARLMQHRLLLSSGENLAHLVSCERTLLRERHRYELVVQQSLALQSLHPALEFLAECFATSAEESLAEAQRLQKVSAGKSPEIRHRRILSRASRVQEFSMRHLTRWFPKVPRRTLERDVASLVAARKLKARGELKARVYSSMNAFGPK